MPLFNPVFWQALSFTAVAMAFVAMTTWWFFVSPLRVSPSVTGSISPRLAGTVAVLLGLGAFQLIVGAFWDASMHRLSGEVPAGADFLWPPHLMIYSSFLLTFLVAGIAIGRVAIAGWRAGDRDPRLWVRRNPLLGTVALASLYAILSIPGDSIWHALYGVDLTAWSPPHLILGFMVALVIVGGLGLVAATRSRWANPRAADAVAIVLSSLLLNVAYMIGVIEWEMTDTQSILALGRPSWAYPLVGGALAFTVLALARRLVPGRWTATLTALLFHALRIILSAGLSITGNLAPALPLWVLLGATALDLDIASRLVHSRLRDLGTAAAFTLGFAALTFPSLGNSGEIPPIPASDLAIAAGLLLLFTTLIHPLLRVASDRLRG